MLDAAGCDDERRRHTTADTEKTNHLHLNSNNSMATHSPEAIIKYGYSLTVYTGDQEFADTEAHTLVKMSCLNETTGGVRLIGDYKRNSMDTTKIPIGLYCGTVCELILWRDNGGVGSAWFIDKIVLTDNVKSTTSVILYNKWLPAKEWVTISVPGTGGKWNEWSSWSICSVPCGRGSAWRRRTCASPLSLDCHAQTCQGPDKDRAACRGLCMTNVQPDTTSHSTVNATSFVLPSEKIPRYGKIAIIVGTGLFVFVVLIGVILTCQRRKHHKRQYKAGCRPVSVAVDKSVKLSDIRKHADHTDDEPPREYAIITGTLANATETLDDNDECSSLANERMRYLMGIDKTDYLIINPQTGQRVTRLGSLGAYEHANKQTQGHLYKGLVIPEILEEGAEARRAPMFRSMSACASYHEFYDHIGKRSNSAGKQHHHYDHMVLDKVRKPSETSAHSSAQETAGDQSHYDCLERPQVLAGNGIKDAGESHYDRLPGDDGDPEENRDSIYF